jgi:hypothetical protein
MMAFLGGVNGNMKSIRFTVNKSIERFKKNEAYGVA